MPALVFKRKGHVKQIGDKFTKYTKNGAFGFGYRHYFFVDHELVTVGAVHRFLIPGAFVPVASPLLLAGYPV
jgi:hypothetical protein